MRDQKQPGSGTVFLNLGMFQLLSFVRRGIFYSFMINYLYGLMQTVTFTALLGTFDMVASALGQNLLWGKVSDRYQLRTKLILIGESIAAVAYLVVYLIHKSLLDSQKPFVAGLSLVIGLAFLEFFWSMSDVGWAALLTDVTTMKSRGRVVGSMNFLASFGRMIGINFAGLLYNNGEGFRQGTLFFIVIGMLMAGVMIVWTMPKKVKVSSLFNGAQEKKEVETNEVTRENGDSKTYSWFLSALIVLVIGMTCVSQIFLLYLKLPQLSGGLGASDSEMSLILTTWTLGGMTTSISCGWLADRLGRIKILLVGIVLAIVTPLTYGFASNVPLMAVLYGLNGMAFWMVQTVGFTFAGDIIPQTKRARLLGRYNAVIALSWGPAGLIVGGPLADAQIKGGLSEGAAYINVFLVSSFIVLLGLILFVVRVARKSKKMQ